MLFVDFIFFTLLCSDGHIERGSRAYFDRLKVDLAASSDTQKTEQEVEFYTQKLRAREQFIQEEDTLLSEYSCSTVSDQAILIRKTHEKKILFDRIWNKRAEDLGLIQSIDFDLHSPCHIGLSIDGGGMKGLMPAIFLSRIEEKTGLPIFKLVDFIGGTSIGGLLAAAMVIPSHTGTPMSAETCVSIFKDKGTQIFCSEVGCFGLSRLSSPKYSSQPLKQLLDEYFGEHLLSEALIPVLVTAKDKNNNSIAFKSSGTDIPDKTYPTCRDFYVKDVVQATASAPTYFEAAHIQSISSEKLVRGQEIVVHDGGLWRNNPVDLVAQEMVKKYGTHENIRMISLGTGEEKKQIPDAAGLLDAESIIHGMIQVQARDALLEAQRKHTVYSVQVHLQQEIKLDETRSEYLDLMTAYAETQYEEIDRIAALLKKNFELRQRTPSFA